MKNFEYCFECPFYDKQHEIEYTKKLEYGNGAYDIVFVTEAPCLKHGFQTVPACWKCQEMDEKYIAEQIQLDFNEVFDISNIDEEYLNEIIDKLNSIPN